MLKRRILNLAVAGITIMSATMLTAGVAATGAFATAMAATSPGQADMAGHAVPAITSAATTFRIYQHDGLCLDISGEKYDSPALQFVCNRDKDQTWHWGSGNGEGFAQLINTGGQCLGVAGESPSYEARVVAWTCNGHPDQYWYPLLVRYDRGLYDAFVNYHSGLVLTVDHGSTTNGAGIVQWGWRDYTNQLWY